MRESASSPKNKVSNASGRAFQTFRTLVSKRMIARTETTPVGAIKSPNKREGSGLNSEAVQTSSGSKKAQPVMAMHKSVFPQSIVFKDVHTPNRSVKICTSNSDTNIW